MDFVTVRELRAESGKVWDRIAAGEELVITRNGKPVAILAPTQPSEVESNLRALRGARNSQLLARQHQRSVASGLDRTTLDEINAEIAVARSELKARDAGGR